MRRAFVTRQRAMAALALLLVAGGCGKKGPPLPPLRSYPERVEQISIRQIGDRVVLSFPRPSSRTDGAPLGPDAAVEILMTAREPALKRPADVESSPDATWSIPRADWDAYTQGRRMVVGLSLARVVEAARKSARSLSFVVQVVEAGRKRSIPSDIESFTVCEPPGAPVGTTVEVVEEGLMLTWSAGPDAKSVPDGKYGIYRQEAVGTRADQPLQTVPVDSTSYLDRTALPGTAYQYTVRASAPSGRCESADSPVAVGTFIDRFPPAAPQGLAAVAEKGVIRLFWRPNREADLHGYRVYRGTVPDEELKLLTQEDLVVTSYTDEDVMPGVVYSYAVTARDGASPPNESKLSDPAIEKTEARK